MRFEVLKIVETTMLIFWAKDGGSVVVIRFSRLEFIRKPSAFWDEPRRMLKIIRFEKHCSYHIHPEKCWLRTS